MAIAISVTSHWVASRLATNGASNAEGEVAVVAAAGEVAAGLADLGVDLNGAVGKAVDVAEGNDRVMSGGEGDGGADTALRIQVRDGVS